MKMRGCSKRHTVGCTDDLSANRHPAEQSQMTHMVGNLTPQTPTGVLTPNTGCVSSGMRTRRTGLLTVTERPPGKFMICPNLI